MKILEKILLYTLTLIHIPFTLISVVVASTLLVDLWCDKTINGWINEVEKELKDEEQFFNCLYTLLANRFNVCQRKLIKFRFNEFYEQLPNVAKKNSH